MTRPLPKLLRSLNAYLIEHPVASWIMWALGILIVIPSISFALEPAAERFGPLSWISVAGFGAVLLYFHPRVLPIPHREAVGIRWAVVQIAWLFPWVAVFSHSPQWLVGVGVLEAIALMAVSLGLARDETRGSTGGRGGGRRARS